MMSSFLVADWTIKYRVIAQSKLYNDNLESETGVRISAILKYNNDFESFKDMKKTNVEIDDSSKFPISQYLNKSKYALSFNIRMLGCHSLNRCLEDLDEFKEVFIIFILILVIGISKMG
jgi:hypothetical protein